MKRLITGGVLFLGAVGGCVSVDQGPETGGPRPTYGRSWGPPTVPGVQGPYGAPVPMVGPYNNAPPTDPMAARAMMQNSIPLDRLQMHSAGGMPGVPGMPGTGVPQGGLIAPPGMPAMPGMPGGSPFQPTGGIGPMDGGVQRANVPPGAPLPGGVVQAQFANSSPVGSLFPAQRTQVQFAKPGGMKVYWFSQGADGKPSYSETPLETPGRYNFAQGAIYRLKLTRIPGRPALELYPTLEVVPTGPKTNEFLAHNSVPIEFSEDDFKQVVDRNYIVKVIYLPDPQFQDAAGAGPDEIVSSRLEPGQDPIQEALRRGSILLVLRIGNIDQGLVSSPGLTAPVPGGAPPMQMPMPGAGVPPLFQVPFGPNGPMPFGPGGPLMPPGGMNPAPPNALPPLPPIPGVAPAPPNLPPAPLPAPKGLSPDKIEGIKLPAPAGIDAPPAIVAPKETSSVPSPNPLVVPTSGSKEDMKAPAMPMLPNVTLPPIPPMAQQPEEVRATPPVTPAGGAATPLLPNLPTVPTTDSATSSERPALPPVPTVPDKN